MLICVKKLLIKFSLKLSERQKKRVIERKFGSELKVMLTILAPSEQLLIASRFIAGNNPDNNFESRQGRQFLPSLTGLETYAMPTP